MTIVDGDGADVAIGLVNRWLVILGDDAVADVSDGDVLLCSPYASPASSTFLNDLASFHGQRCLISNPIGAISCLPGPPFTHFP